MSLISNPQGTIQIRAGRFWGKIRMWTVPVDDYIAYPTPIFYRNRKVLLSDEGNILHPKWVALDRYNDEDWINHRFKVDELLPLLELIKTNGELAKASVIR